MYDQKTLARRNVKTAGHAILFCVTLLSVVSTFSIMRDGWKDYGQAMSTVIGFVVVMVIEGTFLWLLRGYAVAFSEMVERTGCIIGLCFYGAIMILNIVIHYRIVKGFGLNGLEMGYVSWGAPMIVGVTLVLITIINMADPKSRQMRQELRIEGKQTQSVWNAKEMAIESDLVTEAVQARAAIEAQQMVERLLSGGSKLSQSKSIGFGTTTNSQEKAKDIMRSRFFGDKQSKN